MRASLVAFVGVAAEPLHVPSSTDLKRAQTGRPTASSHVFGETAADAFGSMNKFLAAGLARTKACNQFDHTSLNGLARILYASRSADLDELYRGKGDKRAFHFSSLDYKEQLWAGEEAMSETYPLHAPGKASYNATRDGKCAEMVMWYTHHLPESKRSLLASSSDFELPLMPETVAPKHLGGNEYQRQITCTDCHTRSQNPNKPPIVTPAPRPKGSGPQFQEDCSDHKKPVFYNRTKRCDWDYEPFCSPCEGVGGIAWGNKEHEWNPMPCEPLMKPEEIPKENLTTPLWPKHFTVQETASLTFPGRDPCNVKFKNSTYTLVFTTTPEGPIYHTIGHSGPSGPSPFPGKSWGYPNGNFFNTVDIFGKSVFCVCLGLDDPTVENSIMGPLSYDFLKGAVLIGRERIVPEYLNTPMVADHWVKGPHHFWFDVATNLMVREWQPFNGHQIYYDWDLSMPKPETIDLPQRCYKGLLHVNASCIGGPPSSSADVLV